MTEEAVPDDMGLIADKALTGLGVAANIAEQIAFRMEDGRDRRELVWLAEHMRDEEAIGRARISALARK